MGPVPVTDLLLWLDVIDLDGDGAPEGERTDRPQQNRRVAREKLI